MFPGVTTRLGFCYDVQMVAQTVWKHESVLPWINSSGCRWWCDDVGSVFNRQSLKTLQPTWALLSMSIHLWPQCIYLLMLFQQENTAFQILKSSQTGFFMYDARILGNAPDWENSHQLSVSTRAKLATGQSKRESMPLTVRKKKSSISEERPSQLDTTLGLKQRV